MTSACLLEAHCPHLEETGEVESVEERDEDDACRQRSTHCPNHRHKPLTPVCIHLRRGP